MMRNWPGCADCRKRRIGKADLVLSSDMEGVVFTENIARFVMEVGQIKRFPMDKPMSRFKHYPLLSECLDVVSMRERSSSLDMRMIVTIWLKNGRVRRIWGPMGSQREKAKFRNEADALLSDWVKRVLHVGGPGCEASASIDSSPSPPMRELVQHRCSNKPSYWDVDVFLDEWWIGSDEGYYTSITHCPWCGEKLPPVNATH